MGELLGGMKRTHMCGVLESKDIGKEVILMGWVQKRRDLGGLIFVDLRDREGLVQIVFDTDVSEPAFRKAEKLRGEFVIAARGEVRRRESINPNLKTGEIEVFVKELKILSESEIPPIHINDEDDAGERLRLKYRYLDLRKPKMQKVLRTRSRIASKVREFLDENGFSDIETPVLTKPTPEGARDYLVPSRVNQGKFYALPQSPQIFKQLLMVSGFDKYYQIVKCFRDEDLRADRQPEFTQIDIEMSFVDVEDVLEINERLIAKVFKDIRGIELSTPFMRMTYNEAMERYGSDKPDLRFGYELKDLNDIVKDCGFGVFANTVKDGGDVKAINIDGGGEKFSKKGMKNLEKLAKTYGAKGLAWMKMTDEGVDSPIAKFLSLEDVKAIVNKMEAKAGDFILFVADKPSIVYASLGALRVEIARKLEIIDDSNFKVLWVTDFPLFEYDEDEDRYYAKHHPFTSPSEEDLEILESNPENARNTIEEYLFNNYPVEEFYIESPNEDMKFVFINSIKPSLPSNKDDTEPKELDIISISKSDMRSNISKVNPQDTMLVEEGDLLEVNITVDMPN